MVKIRKMASDYLLEFYNDSILDSGHFFTDRDTNSAFLAEDRLNSRNFKLS